MRHLGLEDAVGPDDAHVVARRTVGGRARVEDRIDPAVGFQARAKIGDELKAGDALGLLYCRGEAVAVEAAARVRAAYTVRDEPPARVPELIKEVIAQ